jgi:polysaccharide export outer membrane protein
MLGRRFIKFFAVLWFTACQSVPVHPLQEAPPGDTFSQMGEYLLARSDVIGLQVHGDSALTGTFTVDDQGDISLPIAGYIHASGLSARQLKAKVEKALTPYLQNPKVAAWVIERRSFHAYFCGEVMRTGMVTFSEPVTMLQGLAMAGGLTPFANQRLILLRQGTSGHTEHYEVKYEALVKGGGIFDKFHLERGDTIIAE